MRLIFGLGNPAKEYEKTRHNIGFICLDLLREKLGFPDFRKLSKFDALISEGALGEEKIFLVKPQTFMNKSGECVKAMADFYRCKPSEIWLVYDDVDLPIGKIRIRKDGSAGSHNGMKSVIESLGFQNFPRVRIGIESRGSGAPEKQDTSSFVLSNFSKEDQKSLKRGINSAISALTMSLEQNIYSVMERFNGN